MQALTAKALRSRGSLLPSWPGVAVAKGHVAGLERSVPGVAWAWLGCLTPSPG